MRKIKKNVEKRKDEIEKLMSICRNIIIKPPKEKIEGQLITEIKEEDPYLSKGMKFKHGFIRAYPIESTQRSRSIRNQRQVNHFPDYTPVTENRRDSLRWELRQKLIYSHPFYYSEISPTKMTARKRFTVDID
jgi:hypothetical protein